MTNELRNELIYARAYAEGLKAGREVFVQPMVVSYGGKTEIIEDGLCGFASVNFQGNTSFGKWAKANNKAKKNYSGGGLYIWVSEFNQSYTKKSAFASAFARVLMENGINASMESNLD